MGSAYEPEPLSHLEIGELKMETVKMFGVESQRIEDRCPFCGGSLFIGQGGHITCAHLGCKRPGTMRAVEEDLAELGRQRRRVNAYQAELGRVQVRCDNIRANLLRDHPAAAMAEAQLIQAETHWTVEHQTEEAVAERQSADNSGCRGKNG